MPQEPHDSRVGRIPETVRFCLCFFSSLRAEYGEFLDQGRARSRETWWLFTNVYQLNVDMGQNRRWMGSTDLTEFYIWIMCFSSPGEGL